ncbi:MAG: TatD family hydrolase [Burkholderiales bacterium]|nr:TatD family hydrolase [Burkholderiales bacterium]
MIDFHAHLDLYPDVLEVVQEVTKRGIYVLSVTTTPSAWKGTSALAHGSSRIRTALGLHPQLAHLRVSELPLFDQLFSEAMYIGEIGLDGAPEYKRHWELQLQVFDHILGRCQSAGGRVMSIHSRRATTAVLDRLEKFSGAGLPILHWFSGSSRELDRAIAADCWFSVGPAMLASQRSREFVMKMPRDRILTETDGPFAQIEGQSAKPWDCEKATVKLATLWAISELKVDKLLSDNLRSLGAAAERMVASDLLSHQVKSNMQ